jgi:hypothetical protein
LPKILIQGRKAHICGTIRESGLLIWTISSKLLDDLYLYTI